MAKKKHGNFNIPDDPKLPSGWAIVILFVIPEFITKIIACGLLVKRIRSAAERRRLQLFRRYASAIGVVLVALCLIATFVINRIFKTESYEM
mgnify:CR=1 FL=1